MDPCCTLRPHSNLHFDCRWGIEGIGKPRALCGELEANGLLWIGSGDSNNVLARYAGFSNTDEDEAGI